MTDPDELISELETTAGYALGQDTLVMVTPRTVLALAQYVRELKAAQPCGCRIGTCESKADRRCRMAEEISGEARIAELEAQIKAAQEQEPVAAQHRFRSPEKNLPDWSPWYPCEAADWRAPWNIDSQGYEIEYRPLYAAPIPAPASVPEGWKLVPIEPTYEMEIAGSPIPGVGRYSRRRLYQEMLAAAPTTENGG